MSRTFGLALILCDPDLRLIAGLMTLQGAFVCTLGPYLSVLAVRQFGLGDRGYAVVMVASTLVAGTALMTAAPRPALPPSAQDRKAMARRPVTASCRRSAR